MIQFLSRIKLFRSIQTGHPKWQWISEIYQERIIRLFVPIFSYVNVIVEFL